MGHGCCSCCDEVPELRQEVAELKKLVAELLEKLNRNSRNSSMPPSSDGPQVPPKPGKPPTGRKPGGQPGHQRHVRELAAEDKVDRLVEYRPRECRACHALLLGDDPKPERVQRLELEEGTIVLIEYRLHSLPCLACQAVTSAVLPVSLIRGPLGVRLAATLVLLTGAYRLSKRRAVSLLADLFGVQIAVGTVSAYEQEMSAALKAPVEKAQDYIKQQPIKQADETTWNEGIKRCRAWLWVAVTPLVSVFLIQPSRATQAAQELLGKVFGVLVTDRLGSYNWWPLEYRQICWAHLKRHFQKFIDAGGQAAWIGVLLQRERIRLFRLWRCVRDGTLSYPEFQEKVVPLRSRVQHLLRQGAACSHNKTEGTCFELLKVESAMWTFTRVMGVEPTNNASEQSLRTAVIWRKLSFGTHSPAGSRFVERMLTVTTSLRQQRRNVLDYLTCTLTAMSADQPAPSIIPA